MCVCVCACVYACVKMMNLFVDMCRPLFFVLIYLLFALQTRIREATTPIVCTTVLRINNGNEWNGMNESNQCISPFVLLPLFLSLSLSVC